MHPHRRQLLRLGAGAALAALLGGPRAARAAAEAELITLQVQPAEGELLLDFAAAVTLPRVVEDALQRGVPIYFMAEATLWRRRWYWRDERIARARRTWRLAYQPLTASWRVSLGGLNQNYATLFEAMAVVTRAVQWPLAEASQIDAGSRYYVDFFWRLDTSQLPSPISIGLIGGSEFALGVERTFALE
jgi:hypothetical protein